MRSTWLEADRCACHLRRRKARASAATIAGLQHKDMLKTRKRQLAAVLGAISGGDDLALDQALAARYPNVPGAAFSTPKPADYIPFRAKRQRRRKFLLAPAASAAAEQDEGATLPPEGDFDFEIHSACE